MNKFSMMIQLAEAEDGFVITVNALGTQRQFVAGNFDEAKSKIQKFVEALEIPKKA